MSRTSVLVIEDDPNIVDLIRSNLLARGFEVEVSTTGRDVSALIDRVAPDIVLLDLMLPGVDGFDVCREIRQRSSVGLIVVSARGGEHDKVRALNMGADDYLTKPFGVDELLARMTATLRRSRPVGQPASGSAITIGHLRIDHDARAVYRDGERVQLTPTEFSLLWTLAADAGKLFTYAELLGRVWGPGYQNSREYVRVYVGRLRSKLEVPGAAPMIVTEPRAGYRLVVPDGT